MIELESVYKSFDSKQVLRNLSLTVKAGEKIAIIGPSGCGKSTILRLIMGLHVPNQGDIRIEGRSTREFSDKDWKKARLHFGMLFQSSALFDSMTVFDNVGFSLHENFKLSAEEIQRRVLEKLELVGMAGTGHELPSGLSGGMKKRIGLARAIAANPTIVLYDEPTTGLDPILSTQIEDLIVKLNTQLRVTSIVVTHQHSTIFRTADKIYMMHEGGLLPPETPHSLRHSPHPIIREFLNGGSP